MLLAASQERVLENVVPGADAGAGCVSSLELLNSGNRLSAVEVEVHDTGGAWIALGKGTSSVNLPPGARKTYTLEAAAWMKVRERISLREQGRW